MIRHSMQVQKIVVFQWFAGRGASPANPLVSKHFFIGFRSRPYPLRLPIPRLLLGL
jgi:hypothetical protein